MFKYPDIKDCTAVILAGGLGTRLRSVVSDRPKPLAEVHNRPFLTYLLDQLVTFEIRYAVLCTGYLGEQVKAVLGSEWKTLALAYSQEHSPLGTGGAIRLAMPKIQSETTLIMNGDSYFSANLKDFWIWHHQKNAKASLLLAQVNDTQRFGRVQVNDEGQVLKFEEKGNAQAAGWINAGIYLIQKPLLEFVPEKKAISLEQEVFPTWIGQGFYGSYGQGNFLDIGTPESYQSAAKFFGKH